MTLTIIFIGLFIFASTFLFVKIISNNKLKKWLTISHLILLIILLFDLFLLIKYNTSFKTIWVDRLIIIAFIISGALIFTLFRKSLNWMSKIYFGAFFIYPIFAALTFLIDRLLFILFAFPIVMTLICPDNYYSSSKYDIRTVEGIMGPKQVKLIKKDLITETEIGKSTELFVGNGNYKNFKILVQNNDSTTVSVDIDDKQTNLTFKK